MAAATDLSRTISASGRRRPEGGARLTPLVPSRTIAGTALTLVVAIMTLLAGLAIGAVTMVGGAVESWQTDIGREVTIEVRPPPTGASNSASTSTSNGTARFDMDGQLKKVSDLVSSLPGVGGVRALSIDETHRLLEPWLGQGFDFSALPVPRLVVVSISDPAAFRPEAVRAVLGQNASGATLDDHQAWVDRLRAAAGTFIVGGVAVLALVLAALVLSVIFATRAAMAGNRQVIEVLHFCGAEDKFVAAQFQRHFLLLGIRGGLVGGGAAALVYLVAGLATRDSAGIGAADQIKVLLGDISTGWYAYPFIALLIAGVAALTAVTSRLAVRDYLNRIE